MYKLSIFFLYLQLHRPADPGIVQFWIDFNVGSQTVAMFVDDPYTAGCGNPEDSMWEYVAVRKDALKHWTVEGKHSLSLSLSLSSPVYTYQTGLN